MTLKAVAVDPDVTVGIVIALKNSDQELIDSSLLNINPMIFIWMCVQKTPTLYEGIVH